MKESRRVLLELYIGIAIYVAVFMVIGAVFMRPLWLYELAIMVGGIAACLLLYHIYDCLDRALEMQSKGAKSFATSKFFLRLAARAGLMIGAILIDWAAFVGVAIGLLSPKVSAYFNPQIKKLMAKFMLERVDDTLDIEQK